MFIKDYNSSINIITFEKITSYIMLDLIFNDLKNKKIKFKILTNRKEYQFLKNYKNNVVYYDDRFSNISSLVSAINNEQINIIFNCDTYPIKDIIKKLNYKFIFLNQYTSDVALFISKYCFRIKHDEYNRNCLKITTTKDKNFIYESEFKLFITKEIRKDKINKLKLE